MNTANRKIDMSQENNGQTIPIEQATIYQRRPAAIQGDASRARSAEEVPTIYQPHPGAGLDGEARTTYQPRPETQTYGSDSLGAASFQHDGGGRSGQRLPSDLSDRFELVPTVTGDALLGSGGEADVWHARTRSGEIVALKVYRPETASGGQGFDESLRRRLDKPEFAPHVPRIYEWGRATDAWGRAVAWEALEYFPLGSLLDLVEREGLSDRQLGTTRAREVVEAVATALDFWENVVGERQIDLSPGNIMLRNARPLQVVLSDFGGVRGTGLSQAVADLQVKIGYMAPEALGNGNHAKSPFWSLGMICYELLTGHSIVTKGGESTFRVLLATDDIDVSDIPDARWRMLIEGLLTRSIENRWGATEVNQWLANESPAVHRLMRSTEQAKPIEFDGHFYDDPRLLVASMANNSDRAVAWLQDEGAHDLRGWLTENFPGRFDGVYLAGINAQSEQAHIALSRLVAAFLPDQRPVYRGWQIDEEGLLLLANDPQSAAFLRRIVDSGVLRIAAQHRCTHGVCSGASCAVLSELGPRITAGAAKARDLLLTTQSRLATDSIAVTTFGGQLAVGEISADEIYAHVAQMLLSAELADAIGRRIRQGRTPRREWWQELASAVRNTSHTTADGAAARVAAEHLLSLATAYRRAEEARRHAAWGQKLRALLARLGAQFVGSSYGTGRSFTVPNWISAIIFLLIPVAAVEPPYWAYVRPRHIPRNADIMDYANRFIEALAPYTAWTNDLLTPWLQGWFPGQQWKALTAYPVVMIIALALIRRSRRGWRTRGLLGLLGAVVGLIFTAGLVLHLISNEFKPLWVSFATMGWAALLAPAVALIATRILAGPAR
jgi:hypothetical protein